MSGRKDYSYILEAARIVAQKAEILARRAERSRQTRARLERAKADAGRRAAELGQRQRQLNQQRMQQAAELSRLAVEAKARQAKEAAQQKADQAEEQKAAEAVKQAELGLQQEIQRRRQAEIAAAEAVELHNEIESQAQTVLQWQQSFLENEDVQNFASDQLASWQQSTARTIGEVAGEDPSADLLSKLQQAAAAAEQLASYAGEVSDQFHTRNTVMNDIIDSLKEIGFFVQDPEFADPNHPEGAVILRANRGNQNLTTSVSLDQKVESDWQGVHGEYCTGSFFEYVKAMDDRGVKITPSDPNLRPRLLQKGAKDLPGGQQRSVGGNE